MNDSTMNDNLKVINLTSMSRHTSTHLFNGEINIQHKSWYELNDKQRFLISFQAGQVLKEIYQKINMAHAINTCSEERAKRAEDFARMIESAGFKCSWFDVLDNQYCKESCCYHLPWIKAYTNLGPITIGWRKRVINLDWSESKITSTAEELFSNEDTTKGEQYIHCWGIEKLEEYLDILK